MLALSDAPASSLEAAALVAAILGVAAAGLRAGLGERASLAATIVPVGAVVLLRPISTPVWVALLAAGTLVLAWASRPE